MVKIYKLSRKQSGSEILNSNKTKKYQLFDNRNYKKNIEKLIVKNGKNGKNGMKNGMKNGKKNGMKNDVQDGGSGFGSGRAPPEYGKYNPQTGLIVNTKDANRDAKKKFKTTQFDIFTKEQYFWLKRNIYNTIRGSWLLKVFGKITEEEHELLKRLLKSHMYFARIKLVMVKLLAMIKQLYGTHDSIIKKMQRRIRKIFDLQMDIEYAFKNPNEAHKKQVASKNLKRYWKKFVGILPGTNKYTLETEKKSYEVFVKDIIKKQDKLRKKIIKQTMFYNTADLGSRCNITNVGKTAITLFGSKGITKGFRKSKKLICAIGRYRKYEAKFNKYYYLFREQYKKFISVYPSCDGTADTQVFSEYLNIDEAEENKNSEYLYYKFDKTKCDSYELKKGTDKLLEEGNNLLKKNTNKNNKKPDEDKKIDDAFMRKGVDLKDLMTEFTKYINFAKRLFQNGEAYGIRHHHGLPKKKSLWSKLKGTSQRKILAKPGRFEELSKEPVFIKEFTDMIKGFAEDVKSMFQPSESEKTIRESIVPYIQLYKSYKYYDDDTRSNISDYNVENNFNVFSINLAKIQNKKYDNTYFYDEKIFPDITTMGRHALPVVVCVQNGYINIDSNKSTEFEMGFLKGLYIPVAYSYSYNGEQTVDTKAYNIIYIRKECIDDSFNRVDDIVPINQTDYFTLKNIPEGAGITLEKFNKSFAAVNLNIINDRPDSDIYEYIDVSGDTSISKNDLEAELISKLPIKGKNKKIIETKFINLQTPGINPTKAQLLDLQKDIRNIKSDDPDLANKMEQFIKSELANIIAKDKAAAAAAAAAAKQKNIDAAEWAQIEKDKNKCNLSINQTNTDINQINNIDPAINLQIQNLKTKANKLNKEAMSISDDITNFKQTNQISDAKVKLGEMKKKETEIKDLLDQANILNTGKTPSIIDPNALLTEKKKYSDIISGIPPEIKKIKDLKNKDDVLLTDQIKIAEDAFFESTKIYENNIKNSKNIIDIEKQKIAFNSEIKKILKAIETAVKLPDIIPIINDLQKYKDEITDLYNNKQKLYDAKYQIPKIVYDNFMKQSNLNLLQQEINNFFRNLESLDANFIFSNILELRRISKLSTPNINSLKILKLDNIKFFIDYYYIMSMKSNITSIIKFLDLLHNIIIPQKIEIEKELKQYILDNPETITAKKFEINTNLESFWDTAERNMTDEPFIENIETTDNFDYYLTDDTLLYTKFLKTLNDDERDLFRNYATKDNILEFFKDQIQKYPTKKDKIINFYKYFFDIYKQLFKDLPSDLPTAGGALPTINGGAPPKQAFTIVTTELVGSRVEDLLYIEEIVNFKLRSQQLLDIKTIILKYNGFAPDIICGDFGGTKDNIDDAKLNELYELYKAKINKIRDETKIKKLLENFYKINDSYYNNNNLTIDYTNLDTKLISNYIFLSYSITGSQPNTSLDDSNDPIEFDNMIKNYGGILPVVSKIDSFNLHTINNPEYIQERGKSYKNVKLYTETEIYAIIRMIDKLMSQFTYGYKAYLKRDLGCFSFKNKSKPISSGSIKDIDYSIRVKDNKNADSLKNFYTMSYPAFIDVFLYQLSGFYNVSSASKPSYYSENQISRTETKHTATEKLNFLLGDRISKETDLVKDTIVRMLLIPSDELKLISDVPSSTTADPKLSKIDFDIMSAKDYMKLAQKFSKNFYREYSIPALESRLKSLLNITDIDTKDVRYTEKANLEVEGDILNRGLLYKLLEIDDKAQLAVKDKDGNKTGETKEVKGLKNISKPELIENLFEFIFIILKLKFLDKQIEDIDKAQLAVESPIVMAEKFAIFGEEYKDMANKLYDIWNKLKINNKEKNILDMYTDILKEISNKLDLFTLDLITNPPIILININDNKKIEKPQNISSILELKNVSAYVAYALIILIINKLSTVTEYNLDNINKINSSIKLHYDYINNLENKIGVIIDEDRVLGENIKNDIIKPLITKYKIVYSQIIAPSIPGIPRPISPRPSISSFSGPISSGISSGISGIPPIRKGHGVTFGSRRSSSGSINTDDIEEPDHYEEIKDVIDNHKDTIGKLFLILKKNYDNATLKTNFEYGVSESESESKSDLDMKQKFIDLLRCVILDENNSFIIKPGKIKTVSFDDELVVGGSIGNGNSNSNYSKNKSKMKKSQKGGSSLVLGSSPNPLLRPGTLGGTTKTTIYIKGKSINTLLKEETKLATNNIFILNFATIDNIGGEVLNGFMGEEEELCRTSPEFYESLKNIKEIDNITFPNDKILYVNNSRYLVNVGTKLEIPESLLGEIVVTPEVTFVRNDGCADPPEDAYKLFDNTETKPSASIISLFTPNKNIIENSTVDAEKYTENFVKQFKYNITKILSKNQNKTDTKPKTLIIGTGIFGKNFLPDSNQKNYINDLINQIISALIETDFTSCYEKILFAVPKKSITPNIIDSFLEKFSNKESELEINNIIVDLTEHKPGSKGGPPPPPPVIPEEKTIEEKADIFMKFITDKTNNNVKYEDIETNLSTEYTDKSLVSVIIDYLIKNQEDDKYKNFLNDNEKMNLNFIVEYQNKIDYELELEYPQVYPNVFTVKNGNLLEDLTENTIIVDSAGTLFKNPTKNTETGHQTFKYTGDGISKDVYTYCKTIKEGKLVNLLNTEIDSKLPGEIDEIKSTDTFVNIETIYCQTNVKGNTQGGTNPDVDNDQYNNINIKGLYHVYAPDGKSSDYTDVELFKTNLTKTLTNLKDKIQKTETDKDEPIDLHIPLISSGIYRNDKLEGKDYMDFYFTNLNTIFEPLKNEYKKLKITVYILGDPINQDYKDYAPLKSKENNTNFCLPVKDEDIIGIPIDQSPISPPTTPPVAVPVTIVNCNIIDAIIREKEKNKDSEIFSINLTDDPILEYRNFITRYKTKTNDYKLMQSSPQLFNSLKTLCSYESNYDFEKIKAKTTTAIDDTEKICILINNVNIYRDEKYKKIDNKPKANFFNIFKKKEIFFNKKPTFTDDINIDKLLKTIFTKIQASLIPNKILIIDPIDLFSNRIEVKYDEFSDKEKHYKMVSNSFNKIKNIVENNNLKIIFCFPDDLKYSDKLTEMFKDSAKFAITEEKCDETSAPTKPDSPQKDTELKCTLQITDYINGTIDKDFVLEYANCIVKAYNFNGKEYLELKYISYKNENIIDIILFDKDTTNYNNTDFFYKYINYKLKFDSEKYIEFEKNIVIENKDDNDAEFQKNIIYFFLLYTENKTTSDWNPTSKYVNVKKIDKDNLLLNNTNYRIIPNNVLNFSTIQKPDFCYIIEKVNILKDMKEILQICFNDVNNELGYVEPVPPEPALGGGSINNLSNNSQSNKSSPKKKTKSNNSNTIRKNKLSKRKEN